MTRNYVDSTPTPIRGPARYTTPVQPLAFVPRPLILVEKMKARRLLVELSSPRVVDPESSNCLAAMMALPLLARLTPTEYQTPTCNMPFSDSCSSSRISNLVSLRDESFAVSRSVRPLSAVTLVDSSSSADTDTLVADSPCWIQRAISKAPVRKVDIFDILRKFGPRARPKGVYNGIPLPTKVLCQTQRSMNAFDPFFVSAPFGFGESRTNSTAFPTSFTRSTTYSSPTFEQTLGCLDGLERMPSVSIVNLFDASKDCYTVKLPRSRFTIALPHEICHPPSESINTSCSDPTNTSVPLVMSPTKLAPDVRRSTRRVVSSSPTLVLDGVFALPHASQLSSLQSQSWSPPQLSSSSLDDVSCRRVSKPRRTLSNIANKIPPRLSSLISLPPSPTKMAINSIRRTYRESPTSSPSSKLARVPATHANVLLWTQTRPCVAPTRREHMSAPIELQAVGAATNDPTASRTTEGKRAQSAIEDCRRHRCCGNREGDENHKKDKRSGVGPCTTMERMLFTSVGRVAKLRAQWETGAVRR